MMNKPLTKEEREEIELFYSESPLRPDTVIAAQLLKYIAAEAYWREAVKNSEIVEYYDDVDSRRCYWCGVEFYDRLSREECLSVGLHKNDCPWKLAQEPQ